MTDVERLPSGRHHLTRDQVADSQRRRLQTALIAVAGERGWPGTRIADVVGRAGVSRATFYDHYVSLDDCLVKAFEMAIAAFLEDIGGVAVGTSELTFRERLPHYVRLYVEAISRIEGLPRVVHLEMLRASDEVLDARRRTFEIVVTLLLDDYQRTRELEPDLPPRSRAGYNILIGGFDDLLRERIRHGASPDSVVDELVAGVEEFFDIAD